jgi:hypothetical protein
MTRRRIDRDELKRCECGQCDLMIRKYVSDHRLRKYAKGHQYNIPKKLSEETKKKIGLANKGRRPCDTVIQKLVNYSRTHTGEKATNWKGDKVGYHQLHHWIRKRLPKLEFCEICKKVPPTEVANITGMYNRELKNWGWFCRRCHMDFDNLIERTIKKRWERNKLKLDSNSIDSYL